MTFNISEAVVMTPIQVATKAPQSVVSVPDVSEQRQWWQLEEVNLMDQE